MKIGIYGGTFDPPHLGHMEAAKAALDQLGLDRLLIIPDREPPHKDLAAEAATPQQRLDMAALMADGLGPRAEASDLELRLEGKSYTADTVEELADKLGLPKDTFTATVDRYNELAAKGEDEDYGKEDYRLSTLSEAPFYGVRQAGGYLICTIDGIQIDDNMHAIDQDFKAIPGLYVIGDMSGNYFSGSYPSLMAGAAAGRSATFGRFAGQNAAAGI